MATRYEGGKKVSKKAVRSRIRSGYYRKKHREKKRAELKKKGTRTFYEGKEVTGVVDTRTARQTSADLAETGTTLPEETRKQEDSRFRSTRIPYEQQQRGAGLPGQQWLAYAGIQRDVLYPETRYAEVRPQMGRKDPYSRTPFSPYERKQLAYKISDPRVRRASMTEKEKIQSMLRASAGVTSVGLAPTPIRKPPAYGAQDIIPYKIDKKPTDAKLDYSFKRHKDYYKPKNYKKVLVETFAEAAPFSPLQLEMLKRRASRTPLPGLYKRGLDVIESRRQQYYGEKTKLGYAKGILTGSGKFVAEVPYFAYEHPYMAAGLAGGGEAIGGAGMLIRRYAPSVAKRGVQWASTRAGRVATKVGTYEILPTIYSATAPAGERGKRFIEANIGQAGVLGAWRAAKEVEIIRLPDYKGVSVLGKPIIGRSPGKTQIGKPDIKFPKEMVEHYIPRARAERSLAARAFEKEASAIDKELVQRMLRQMGLTKKTPSKFISETLPKTTRTLPEKGVKKIDELIFRERGLQYGSRTAKAQMETYFAKTSRKVREAGDIDTQFPWTTTRAEHIAEEGLKGLQAMKIKARAAKERKMLIETKLKGKKKYEHAWDVHARDDPLADIQPHLDKAWGMDIAQKPIAIEGQHAMPLSEHIIRKGAEASMRIRRISKKDVKAYKKEGIKVKEGELTILPEPHRIKDVPDFMTAQEVGLASKKLGKKALERELKELKRIEQLWAKKGIKPPKGKTRDILGSPTKPSARASLPKAMSQAASAALLGSKSPGVVSTAIFSPSPISSKPISSPSPYPYKGSPSKSLVPSPYPVSPSKPSSPSRPPSRPSPYPSPYSPPYSPSRPVQNIIAKPPPYGQELGFFEGKTRTKTKGFRKGYAPSLTALLFNIRGKAPKQKVYSGLEFRPIVESKGKWPDPFGFRKPMVI